ncbi:protein RDM16-like isoform X1 [Solanum stenotomum]|uniref:protein RDM16-like isoform X1 n=2 Tax=Solanum stenotomum TaxID=172797 RepID=UPI0020D0768B|nr:protein RDM16-like isoform X1 [Solanum stenotomum]
MEREKSSRRERGSRDGDGDDDHRRHRHRSKQHRDEENRHRSDDRRRQDRERSVEREGSRGRGHYREDENQRQIDDRRRDREREGSIDRAYDRERHEKSRDQDRCEKSFELEVNREDSMERRNSHKRKDRGENVDTRNVDEKRARGSEVKKDKLRVGDVKLMDKEDVEIDEEKKGKGFEMRTVKEEPKRVPFDDGQGVDTIDTSVAMGSYSAASRTSPDKPLTRSDSPATKVSSISTTNENKGVNINRFHKVLGKSSTDGAARDTGKSATLSIDAKGNANDLKQRHKVLKEKLKRIPLLIKGANSTRDGSSQMGSKESLKAPSTNVAILPPPVASSDEGILPTPGSERSTSSIATMVSVNMLPSSLPHVAGLTAQSYEAMKRAQEFSAKIEFRQDPECPSLTNMFPGQMPPEVIIQPKLAKATVLCLDAFGREIDEQGNVVNVPKPSSTLKVNINKQNKESFQLLKPELDIDLDKNPHFDPRMGIDKNKILRPKKMSFQFVEEGKWSRDAEIIKLKSQFGELRTKELRIKQVQLAKAKAEPDINPNLIEVSERIITKEKSKEPIPDVEWWEAPLLRSGAYGVMVNGNLTDDMLKMERITIYVEHPCPIEPPAEPAPPPPQPLKLTKKEQKKMRTRRRMDQEREKQEMIRQGLLEPPKPKIKMSNLMRVLGSEATQDPTKLEKEIRSAAAEREQAHIDRNLSRMLTPDELREKKERRLFDDPTIAPETIVSVYRINDLSHPQNRFKVDVNAQENRMTGCAVILGDINVVVVEGGKKSIKRYGKLMLRRIDWAAAVKKEDEDEDEEKPLNKCVLVWQGIVAKSSFHRFLVHECRTEAAARKVFADAGVLHYWNFAVDFKDDEL